MRGELDPLRDLARTLDEQSDKRRPRPSAGHRTVQPEDVIGGSDCWCGREQNHDYPGKEDGAPHPRYPD